jgi:hypothetical protein
MTTTGKRGLWALALALGLALATAGPAWAATSGPQSDVVFFSFNSSVLVELYNMVAGQGGSGNLTLSSFPAQQVASALRVTLHNSGTTPDSPCLQVVIYDKGNPVVWCSSLVPKVALKPGETRVMSALDFDVSSSFGGGFDQNFANNELKGLDASSASKFLTRSFTVCANVLPKGGNGCTAGSSSGPAGGGSQGSCCNMTIMVGNPNADCRPASPLYPGQGQQSSSLYPGFAWTPAFQRNTPPSQVSYLLEVGTGDPGSAPLARVDVPSGISNYQWGSKDVALAPATLYWWRVTSLDAQGQPFCGAGGQGQSLASLFSTPSLAAAPCSFSPQQADLLMREKAAAARENIPVLSRLKPSAVRLSDGSAADELLCRIRDGKASVTESTLYFQ